MAYWDVSMYIKLDRIYMQYSVLSLEFTVISVSELG